MSREDYVKANKLAKRDYHVKTAKGEIPTLPVLDYVLPPKGTYKEESLGLVDIPIDQIVGTKSAGRSNAFAANYMPLLRDDTEFAGKWISLSISHEKEGIRDAIKAYEYMNKFYIEEGNKRVSVMKYYGATMIPGHVTRIVPKATNEKENRLYYEFMTFYRLSKVNYIAFSELGRFARLQAVIGKGPEEEWTDDDRLDFSSIYSRFSKEFHAKNQGRLKITPADAFLALSELYGYKELQEMGNAELKKLISKSWEEYVLLEKGDGIDIKMDPNSDKVSLLDKLLPSNIKVSFKGKLKIAFIYEKTPRTSSWTYGHELGRLYLEQKFPEEVSTIYYEGITRDDIQETIDKAVKQGCDIIFTTTPSFAPASVKAAIAYPNVRILNCSLNTSHRYIRTYYIRMHEAKFLMGAIAGVLAENNKIGYIADYPIFGAIANINAFALGAELVNPKAKIYLEWSTKKHVDAIQSMKDQDISIISGMDMVIPDEGSRYFGLYSIENEWPRNLAMPVWHWGRFYEQMIRTILEGKWSYDDSSADKKAINYWWGMSSGVASIICSNHLPTGTRRLVELIKMNIKSGAFNPFSGDLYSQTGSIQENTWESLSPDKIMKMEWLAHNVIGSIPKQYELDEKASSVVLQQGVGKAKE